MYIHKLPRHTNVLSVDVKQYLQKSFLDVLPSVLKPAIFQGPSCMSNELLSFSRRPKHVLGAPEQISVLK